MLYWSKVYFDVHKTVCNIHIVSTVCWAVNEDQFFCYENQPSVCFWMPHPALFLIVWIISFSF